MKFWISVVVALGVSMGTFAQTPVTITINTGQDTSRISPYIYGSNGQGGDREANVTARRLGGNRMTGYNWVNNASNAGSDYYQESDDYMTYIEGIPESRADEPGIVCTSFHDTSLAMNCRSVITLPAAGYVAADKNGIVTQAQTAPSSRWKAVQFAKGAPYSLTPDTNDGAVYDDEEVNLFVQRYGTAGAGRGVNCYEIDNEPALWPSTHPRIHPTQTTCAEVIDKAIALARAVKAVDSSAEIFGPAAYGFEEYLSMQDAPDWSVYSTQFDWFLSAYLHALHIASDTTGRRLLDVLDLHWYPEAQGYDTTALVRIAMSNDSSPGVAWARMQAPRTLWDSTYTENSWIGQYFSPVALLPHIFTSIHQWNPGTKLAFTELNYGGDNDISGGIAMADVLGLFGKYGVYMSNHWGALTGYTAAAYRLYRNYDRTLAAPATFGAAHVFASTDLPALCSVYAATESNADSTLHLILINKDTGTAMNAVISIAAHNQYYSGRVWGFGPGDTDISELAPIPHAALAGNTFHYMIPPVTACHIVLVMQSAAGIVAARSMGPPSLSITPNPTVGIVTITLPSAIQYGATLTLYDVMGNALRQWHSLYSNERIAWNTQGQEKPESGGVYFVRLNNGSVNVQSKIIVFK